MNAIITIGIPASGKSTWAKTQTDFKEVNLDDCRKAICGDESNQEVTVEALALRSQMLEQLMANKEQIIVSDTNVVPEYRQALIRLFQASNYKVTLVAFDTPYEVCVKRNTQRDRVVPTFVMERMQQSFDLFPVSACAQKYNVELITKTYNSSLHDNNSKVTVQ